MNTPAAATQDTGLNVFLPFERMEKQTDGTLRVWSVLNDETVDDQGEIVDYEGGKAALDEFMKFANVREMHQASAVGLVEAIDHDDVLRKSVGVIHVIDPAAVAKVEAKVYKGTSLGGWKRGRVMEKSGGVPVVRVTKPLVNEISLVDRPSRPTALLSLMKIGGIEEPAPDPEPIVNEAAEDETAGAAVETASSDGTFTEEPLAQASTGEAAPGAEPEAPAAETGIAAAGDNPAEAAAVVPEPAEGVAAPLEGEEAATEPAAAVESPVEPVEEPALAMAYAAVIGDLAKRTASGDALPPLARAMAPFFEVAPTPPSEPAQPATEDILQKIASGDTIDASLEKIANAVVQKIGSTTDPAAVAAMQSTLTGISEAVEKMAKQAAPGGPLRYAMDSQRFRDLQGLMDNNTDGGAEATEVLAKAAREATDPISRETLGRLAASRQIRTAMSGEG